MNNMLRLLTLSLIATFLFAQCKSDPKTETTTIEYKYEDNNLRMRIPSDARYMNPCYFRGYEYYLLSNIFPPLVDFNPQTLEMQPTIVKSMPKQLPSPDVPGADGLSFEFELLDEAVWDDGKPVTGHDYAFTIKALFNPEVPSAHIAAYLQHIYDVVVDKANPKKFTVLTRRNYILAEPTISNIPVVPAHIYDPTNLMTDFSIPDLTDSKKVNQLVESNPKLAEFAEQFTSRKYSREVVSGCGPYEFVEWIDKQRIVFAKKKNWWGSNLTDKYPLLSAHPDTLTFLIIKDENATIAAIKDEEIDAAMSINSNLFDELKNSEKVAERYNFFTPETYNFFYDLINTKKPYLSDPKVRRAIAHLYDIDKEIEAFYAGYGKPMVLPFPEEEDYFRDDLPRIAYDLEKARQLLDEAGWTDTDDDGIRDKVVEGEKRQLSISYLGSGTIFFKNHVDVLIENGKKVGIDFQSEELAFNKIIRERLPARDYDMAGMQAAADPLASLDPTPLWSTSGDVPNGYNRAGFGTPETDAIIEEITTTQDATRRKELQGKLQQAIYDNQPWIMLFSPKERVVVHKRFEGAGSKLKPGVHPKFFKRVNE